jgi:hypothetical protein
MTNTANDTTTASAQPLSWTGKNEWGSVGNTYRAEADGWRYCVDSPKKGSWVLRGWGPDDRFLYRDGFTTMKSAKAAAGDHLDGYRADMQRAAAALKGVPAAAAKAANGMKQLAAVIGRTLAVSGRKVVHGMTSTCGCPTPTHRMSCGHGAVPTVVKRAGALVLVDEGAALLKHCTGHKLDCSKGRN